MEFRKPLTLIITGLNVEQARQLADMVLEIVEKDPTGHYECTVKGLENKTIEEVKRVLQEIFPPGGAGG